MRRGHYTPPEPPKKPRLIEITDSWTLRVLERNQEDMACPTLINGRFVDAEDFARWKAALTDGSQHTSTGDGQ